MRLRLLFRDNTTRDVALPVEIWSGVDRYEAVLEVNGPVVGARLWPEGIVPDWNPTNDAWGAPVPGVPGSPPATTGGLSGEIGGPAAP
ncbi:MAG: hypothetical protein JF589_16070 [Gemmatimonadetes bacterium]|nr:hypothetical protein [Gemmatimonadota bacterium]